MQRSPIVDTLLGMLRACAGAVRRYAVAPVIAAVAAFNGCPPVARLRARLARLPPMLALPLFLVPEAASRSGFFISAWLLIGGHTRQALVVYGTSKLCAGLAALWIYGAVEPALLRVRWFAALHGTVLHARNTVAAWWRQRLPPG